MMHLDLNLEGFILYIFYFRTTLIAVAGFLDAFQKVADMATGSRGKQSFFLFFFPLLGPGLVSL